MIIYIKILLTQSLLTRNSASIEVFFILAERLLCKKIIKLPKAHFR